MVTEAVAGQLACRILTGSVNRIVDSPAAAAAVAKRKIAFVPGFVVNSGFVIQLSDERCGFTRAKTDEDLHNIYFTTLSLLQQAAQKGRPVAEVAIEAAESYVARVAAVRSIR
jgi:valine dehydrogenase (NAD+)